MKNRYVRIVIILVFVAIGIWANLPNHPGINIGNFQRSMELILGLDLQGGLQVLLEVPADYTEDFTSENLEVARSILENRSNGLGVSEVMFQVAGSNRIVGEFPGLTDTEEVVDILKTTGQLEFVDTGTVFLEPGTVIKTDLGMTTEETTQSEEAPVEEEVATEDANSLSVTTNEETLAESAGADLNLDQETPEEDETIWHTIMTGDQLERVNVMQHPSQVNNNLVVDFSLKEQGAVDFAEHTANHINNYVCIVLDKKVISCPIINTAITEGEAYIDGDFTYESANNLAIQLRYGSLPVPLEEVETRVVGPTLGKDSLDKSMLAGIIGFVIITLFMLIYYRLPGFVAILSIVIYGLITLTVYKLLPVTLTLPGIAGFLLSTGGALDANILIFERLKEELRSGRKLGQAVEIAWSRAWSSIRDSNAATLITSIILYWFGSAYGATTVKGFALTLAIGVAISLFCAIIVTRTFLTELLNHVKTTNHKFWFGI